MEESDTFLMILDQGRERQAKKDILLVGEARLGSAAEPIKAAIDHISDLERLDRMIRCAAIATNWQEILNTP